MTMEEKEIKYESLYTNIEIHIWASLNRNKNTGNSTVHSFNIHFLGMLWPGVEVVGVNRADTIPSLIESSCTWSSVWIPWISLSI